MSHIFADRIADTTTTTGTGAVTVSGTPATGYKTFSAVCATSDTIYICIAHQSANEWEVSKATYSASNQLTRTTVLASSNSNAAVSFSAGTKDVFIVHPGDRQSQAGLLDTLATSNTRTLASGSDTPAHDNFTWSLSGSSTGIMFARYGHLTISGSSALSGGGHAGGVLGHVDSNHTGTLGLVIGQEGKISNNSSGTITFGVLNELNLGANAGTITTLYGSYITITNAGTIGSLLGYHFPDLTGLSVTASECFHNFDANSPFVNLSKTIGAIGVEFAGPPHPGIVTSRYYWGVNASPGAFFTATPLTANLLYFVPFYCPQRTTFTKIGCAVTTLAASSNVQMAIYNAANGVPTTKILSTASQSSATTGDKEVTISQVLEAGFYYLAVSSGGTPTLRWYLENAAGLSGASTSGGKEMTRYSSGTFGTWPNNPTMSDADTSGTMPQVWLRK